MSEATPNDRAPAVVVETFDEYLIGLPMPLAITLVNRTDDTGMGAIPRFTILRSDAPLEFEWTDAHQHLTSIKAPWSTQEEPRGPTLGPGESLRGLYDLSLLHHHPAPGTYTLRVKLRYYGQVSVSPPVSVRIAAPSHDEAAALALLAPLSEHTWAEFVQNNPRTITPPPLSHRAASLLALHLFLQHAASGSQALAALDPHLVDPLRHPPTEAEADLYRLELLYARHDPAAKTLSPQLAKRWPGLRVLLTRIEKGDGPLATLRDTAPLAPPRALNTEQ